MSSRGGIRLLQHARMLRASLWKKPGIRHQTIDAAPNAPAKSWWDNPVGPKTVHFWAPVMKWGLVTAGAADFLRPADKLSLTQNMALTATGTIWTRWCLIIKPRNVFLASCNFMLACVGIVQVSRILIYQQSLKDGSVAHAIEGNAKDLKDTAVGVARDVEVRSKNALK